MPLTPSAQEFVPPKGVVPSTTVATTKATNATTKEDDEKKNSNSNANEKKKKTTNKDDEEDLKQLPFDLTPHDAFKTDFQIGQKQLGVTPIVHAKKFSKAIAIKKPSVGVKEKTKANATEKEDVEKETTSQSNNTQFPPAPPPLSSSGGGSTNTNSIKIGSVFQKGGRVPTKTTT